jgi:hypothetical protein
MKRYLPFITVAAVALVTLASGTVLAFAGCKKRETPKPLPRASQESNQA